MRKILSLYRFEGATAIFFLSLVVSGAAFGLKILQYYSFFSYEWEDEARLNQLVYNIATFFSPYQTIYNSSPCKILNDHFTPIVFLLAIPYKIFPHIFTLYFLKCFSYGLSALVVYRLAKDILHDGRVAMLLSAAYLFYPPLHFVMLGSIDAREFFLPLFFMAFYYQYAKKFVPYVLFMFLSFLCKEDIPVYFLLLGIYQFMQKYPRRWWLCTGVFAGMYLVVAAYLTESLCRVPTLASWESSGRIEYKYVSWATWQAIITMMLARPWETISSFFAWHKLRVFVMLLYPVLFLPVFSVEFYIAFLPFFIQIGLPPGFFNQNADYLAVMIPFVFIALIYAFKRVKLLKGEKVLFPLAVCVLGATLLSLGGRTIVGCTALESKVFNDPYSVEYDQRFVGVKSIFDKRLYALDANDRIAWEFIKKIPPAASVTATGDLLPAVSSRRYVYEFGLGHPRAFEREFVEYPADGADYVLINKNCMINGLGGRYAWLSQKDLEEEIARLKQEEHFKVKKEDGVFVLLERQGPVHKK